jgi:hypothetical protein
VALLPGMLLVGGATTSTNMAMTMTITIITNTLIPATTTTGHLCLWCVCMLVFDS